MACARRPARNQKFAIDIDRRSVANYFQRVFAIVAISGIKTALTDSKTLPQCVCFCFETL